MARPARSSRSRILVERESDSEPESEPEPGVEDEVSGEEEEAEEEREDPKNEGKKKAPITISLKKVCKASFFPTFAPQVLILTLYF